VLREVPAQRFVYGRGVTEHLSRISVEQNDVRSSLVTLVVLPTHSAVQVVLGPHVF